MIVLNLRKAEKDSIFESLCLYLWTYPGFMNGTQIWNVEQIFASVLIAGDEFERAIEQIAIWEK